MHLYKECKKVYRAEVSELQELQVIISISSISIVINYHIIIYEVFKIS
jgi:hypothetical protein